LSFVNHREPVLGDVDVNLGTGVTAAAKTRPKQDQAKDKPQSITSLRREDQPYLSDLLSDQGRIGHTK
jgi:hypothetical protein